MSPDYCGRGERESIPRLGEVMSRVVFWLFVVAGCAVVWSEILGVW